MKKNSFMKKYLIIAITFLFIFSIITPIVFGYDTKTNNFRLIDDIVFNCNNRNDFSIEEYYKDKFLLQNSDMIKSEEIESTYEILSDEQSVGPMDSPWPMKCHDSHHTGMSQYSTENNNGAMRWRYRTQDWIEDGVVIDTDGTIYFGCFDRNLYALYPDSSLKWKYKTDGWIWSTPVIADDGTLFIGTYGNTLYAIYPNGTLKWKFDAKASISSSPAISNDGTIYFGTGDVPSWGCRIYAVNPNGTEKWYYNTGNKIFSDPAIGVDGTVYIGSNDGYLYAMNPDGSLKWRFKTGDWIKSHPSIADDGTIYFDSFDDYLYALYPNGTLKWKHGGVGCGCASASIDKDGIIYIGGYHLTAIYPNGTRKWRYNFGDNKVSHHSSPAISTDGTIYIGVSKEGSAGGYIYAFDEGGTVSWYRIIANNWATSSPSISKDGTVYIGSSSQDIGGDPYGYFYAFGRNETNQPPNPPEIEGSSIGFRNTQQTYVFSSSDPDLDDIELYVDWGDDTYTGWIGPYESEDEIVLNHTWTERGTYTIQAKARDTYDGSESDWTELYITMPKTKAISSSFIQFLENHPRLFPILRQLLGL